MNQAVLLPSPNSFQVSCVACSCDGWLIYGGPNKSLCVLQRLQPPVSDYNNDCRVIITEAAFQAHVQPEAHSDKIVSVDISPEWPTKRCFLTGSTDGTVTQWNIEQTPPRNPDLPEMDYLTIKTVATHSHNFHSREKEEVVSVGYCNEVYVITVGSCGNLVKWDLNSHVFITYKKLINYKPLCMAVSRHVPFHAAVGTKQGAIIVVDLSGAGEVICKVRGQNEEILNLNWCPQYEVDVRKSLPKCEKEINIPDLSLNGVNIEKNDNAEDSSSENVTEMSKANDFSNESGVTKKLSDINFENLEITTEVEIVNEFEHKKYQSQETSVKEKENKKKSSVYLAKCEIIKNKLKKGTLIKKNKNLVDALEEAHIDDKQNSSSDDIGISSLNGHSENETNNIELSNVVFSTHTHKHLLASISKYGDVRVWSTTGKLVATCNIPNSAGKSQRGKPKTGWPTLLWHKPDVLLIGDRKSQLLYCNPLEIDCKNKLKWQLAHDVHERGMYCIASSAPRVQAPGAQPAEDWWVWSAAQDRTLVCYSVKEQRVVATHGTCGGPVFDIQVCPYNEYKYAICAGDDAIRVWDLYETSIMVKSTVFDMEYEKFLVHSQVTTFWLNNQGNLFKVIWHPRRKNLLAFCTDESRVGLLDVGRAERTARPLVPALRGAVYALCFTDKSELYAAAGGDLFVYDIDKPNAPPITLNLTLEGKKFEVSTMKWYPWAMLLGSKGGAVAVTAPDDPYDLKAFAYPYSEMILSVDWHSQDTSDESFFYKDLIAVSSLDRRCEIIILDYSASNKELRVLSSRTQIGHKEPVLMVKWCLTNDDLMSTSLDGTVRAWSVENFYTHCFVGHGQCTTSLEFMPNKNFHSFTVSGGTDCCVRVWNIYALSWPDNSACKTKIKADKKKRRIRGQTTRRERKQPRNKSRKY